VVEGAFKVGAAKVLLAIRCWGSGSPVVVLEGGSGEGGLGRWEYNPVAAGVAAHTEVCSYDRAGVGESGRPPSRARDRDDVVDDLHDLLRAAGVSPPYLMAGISGGGFYAYHYAGRFPRQVSGLAMIEVPAGQVRMSAADVRDLAWDAPRNDEHVDYVKVEHSMAVDRLSIPPIPVLVVTGRHGQSEGDLASQRVWLKGSSHPRQLLLDTGHEVDQDDPDGLVSALLQLLDTVRRQ
jgi:hypothetical protein